MSSKLWGGRFSQQADATFTDTPVATTVLTTPRINVFFAAAIFSGLCASVTYQSVVNPRHGPPCFAALNEKTTTTTIGAYMKP